MLPEAARAVRKIQGIITFDSGTQLEKKLHTYVGGVHVYTLCPNFMNI